MKKILLMGNPNVGKSVIFSRLTGIDVIASNYPGTTVEFIRGYMFINREKVMVMDVPGIYSLVPASKAEQVAVEMLEGLAEGDMIINIIDSTNLERNLGLTLQLLKKKVPMIIDLNFWDETRHLGIKIDHDKLEQLLGVPVVCTCGVTGEGVNILHERLDEARTSIYSCKDDEKWSRIGDLVQSVQVLRHRHHTILERIGEMSVHPVAGVPIATVIGYLTFFLITFIGEGLSVRVIEPLFGSLWAPVIMKFSSLLDSEGFLHDLLIGRMINGGVDFEQSFGLMTTGLFVPIARVLPYVFSFYLILSFLEDSGYLPRLGILLDSMMHRIGLHGLAVIPMFLGLGCNVPGILSTRVLETRRERFLSTLLISIAVPCASIQAMISGLLGRYGAYALAVVYSTLFFTGVAVGVINNLFLKGESPEIFVEIPPYRIPYMSAVVKKTWMRVKWFLIEAVPFVFLGVFIVNVLYSLGVISLAGKVLSPVIKGVLGLPEEAAGALIIGFLRKDVAVGMLAPLGMGAKQLIIASVVLATYFPCVATFSVILKELGIRDMIKTILIMTCVSLCAGAFLNIVL